MSLDAVANAVYGTVATAPSPATSGTSLVATLLGGCVLPTAPFNCTIWQAGVGSLISNMEIVRVTSYVMEGANATLTVTRAQESTAARTIIVGDQFGLTITAKFRDDLLATFQTIAALVADVLAIGIPQVVLEDNVTVDSTVNGKSFDHTSGSPHEITIPADDDDPLPIGTTFSVDNGAGGGVVTISIDSDTLILASDGSTGSVELAANGVCTVRKTGSTTWKVNGTGLT